LTIKSKYIHTRLHKARKKCIPKDYTYMVLKETDEYISTLEGLIKELIPQHETVISTGDDGCASCYRIKGHSQDCPISKLNKIL